MIYDVTMMSGGHGVDFLNMKCLISSIWSAWYFSLQACMCVLQMSSYATDSVVLLSGIIIIVLLWDFRHRVVWVLVASMCSLVILLGMLSSFQWWVLAMLKMLLVTVYIKGNVLTITCSHGSAYIHLNGTNLYSCGWRNAMATNFSCLHSLLCYNSYRYGSS